MSEKLVIKDFACIKSATVVTNKINILIGPQSTGKSIIVKLFYYFGSLSELIETNTLDGKTRLQILSEFKNKFTEYFPLHNLGNKSFSILYIINDNYIIVEKKRNISMVNFTFSDSIKTLITKCRIIHKKNSETSAASDNIIVKKPRILSRRMVRNLIRQVLGDDAGSYQIFVPAGRSFFANMESNIFTFLSNKHEIDPFLVEFGEFYQSSRRHDLFKQLDKKEKIIRNGIFKILSGEHTHEKGQDYIVSADGRKVKISSSSSGQQEMLPLATLICFIASNIELFNSQDLTVYIEEPEAHLFPSSQKEIVDLLAYLFSISNGKLRIFITTHSPYILTVFNNLMQAGLTYRKSNEAQLDKLKQISPYWVDPDFVSAYSTKDFSVVSLKCSETNLILADIIDNVSDELSIAFGKLLELEETK